MEHQVILIDGWRAFWVPMIVPIGLVLGLFMLILSAITGRRW